MSYNDRYGRPIRGHTSKSSNRGTLTYWLPLAFTVTVATVGIAAWIWSERSNDEEDNAPPPGGPDSDHVYQNYGRTGDGSSRNGPPSYADVRPGEVAYGTTQSRPEESSSYMARMSGALRRTPSPQQVFDGATRSVAAGVAAAGAVVGNALSSIREEDKNAYKDHRTWSEEAETRAAVGTTPAARGIEMRSGSEPGVSSSGIPSIKGKRKTVAIVVSADTHMDFDEDEHHEHAVCLPLRD